ncbi:hypothetical protein ACFQ5J_01505 [Lacticaseibacillus baoqingensis]|uniref:Uncharacterized protein n=1 Tax=Lacticaseibacillus baoqingensis TaxID=2486013 RepID=A0ABW4E5X7_9LACO|nr:hypothetical protein [Lacticaseibacillus baoqingensis]
MEPTEAITRLQKAEGANLIMEKGYITERDEPAMMDKDWSADYLLQVNDELRLRSLTQRAIIEKFNYYMGDGVIIYDPKRMTQADAKRTLRYALGFHK